MARWKGLAVLVGAAVVALAGATARPAHANGTTSQTFGFTGGLQTFTVPNGVSTLTIQAAGALGGEGQGPTVALGASMQGDFAVTPGEQLTMLVGQMPVAGIGGPGGGGSFVWTGTGPVTLGNLLLAAGGGGGGGCLIPGGNASLGPDGGSSTAGIPGGSGGNGGGGGASGGTDQYGGIPGGGGGGGGILTGGQDGQTGTDSSPGFGDGVGGPGGQAISLGGGGGIVSPPPFQPNGNGGYGGGGGAAWGGAGGGGGGFSGGGGGTADNPNNGNSLGGSFGCDGGGGGGSYNAGTNQDNHLSTTTVNGEVVISYAQTDVTPPSITASATSNGNPYTGGTWTNAPVVVHFDCTDAGSGVASVTGDQTVSSDGSGQSVTGTCTDNAGNSASATFSDIQIDTTPPSITASTGSYVPGTPTNQPVVVHFDCTDGGSGVASVTGDQTVSADGLGQSVTGTCVDNAGNSASTTVSNIDIDRTPPTITATAGSYVAGTWTNGDVTVHFDCSDASGVASVSADQTVSNDGADQSATGTCTDNAGNSASVTFGHIDIDKTAPTVTYTGNAGTYQLGDQVTITCSATDALSGVASSTCASISGPAWTFGAGAHTYSATATDNAGNTSSGSTTFTVTVTFGGLQRLVSQFCTKRGVALGMNATLEAAAIAKAFGLPKVEQNLIRAFDNEVRAQSGKSLTAAQATLLIQLAGAL